MSVNLYEKWVRVLVWEDIHSGRILCDIIHSIVQNEVVSFSTSDGSFPSYWSLHSRGLLGHQLEWILAHMIRYLSTDSHQKIFESFPADMLAILRRIPVWHHGTSAICLDLPPVRIFEKNCEILVVPACHHCTPAISNLVNSPLGNILVAVAYDTHPHEWSYQKWNQVEKRPYPSRQKTDRLDGMSCKRCKNRFLSKNVRMMRVGDWLVSN